MTVSRIFVNFTKANRSSVFPKYSTLSFVKHPLHVCHRRRVARVRGSAKSMFRGEAVVVAGDTALVWHEDTGSLAVVTLDTGDCVQADNTLDTGDCVQYQADNTDNSRGDCVVYHSNNTGLRNGRLLDYRHPHLLLAGYDGAGAGRLEVWRVDHQARTVVLQKVPSEGS